MRDEENPAGDGPDRLNPAGEPDAEAPSAADTTTEHIFGEDEPGDFDEGLFDEIAALIDDGRTYAEAEIAFQKTRGKLAGRAVGKAVALALVALITLHIAVLALAVGLVIALEPLVTIWGAIAIVVGLLLVVTIVLGLKARANGELVSRLFGSGSDKGTP